MPAILVKSLPRIKSVALFVGARDPQEGKIGNDGPRRPDAVTRQPGARVRGPDLTSVATHWE